MLCFIKRIFNWYIQFTEKQGFPLIITVCVAVITATALWTGNRDTEYVSPTPPASNNISAARIIQQSIRHAVTPSPAPTVLPRIWHQPLEDICILRHFDDTRMICSEITGIWSIHDAVDLQAKRGAKVFALSGGTVVDCGQDALSGVWILIDHGEGYQALYSGLALNHDYIPGDPVRGGAIIGFCGSGPLGESNMEPHLHLRVTKDGVSIDPTTLWIEPSEK